MDAGAGSLSISGEAGTDEFRLAAKLCASDEDLLEELGVTLRGGRVETDYPSSSWGGGPFSWGRNRYARIDLTLAVPPNTRLRVDDSSGNVHINDTGDVTLEDGSGNIVIRDVGSVNVEDGSGNLQISGANGDVRLRDSSGRLEIEDVTGNLVVTDGSGNVEIRHVTGGVTISDGSGSIRVEAVGGSVHMDRIGSGSVTVRNVEGDLVVTNGRRERIRYTDVRGTVDLLRARRGG